MPGQGLTVDEIMAILPVTPGRIADELYEDAPECVVPAVDVQQESIFSILAMAGQNQAFT
jgi:hypothetical protein